MLIIIIITTIIIITIIIIIITTIIITIIIIIIIAILIIITIIIIIIIIIIIAIIIIAIIIIGYGYDPTDVKIAIKKLLVRRLREMVLQTGRRSDGRAVDEVRPISMEVDLLPGIEWTDSTWTLG